MYRKLLIYHPDLRASPTDLANHPYILRLESTAPIASDNSSNPSSTNNNLGSGSGPVGMETSETQLPTSEPKR